MLNRLNAGFSAHCQSALENGLLDTDSFGSVEINQSNNFSFNRLSELNTVSRTVVYIMRFRINALKQRRKEI